MSEQFSLREMAANLSLLYVEDEEEVRTQMGSVFEKLFGTVYLADDGDTGLDLFSRHRPDMVITDIRMPRMSGIDMAKNIKENFPDQCIAVISAYNDFEYYSDAVMMGLSAFLLKPVQVDQLMNVLHKLVKDVKVRKENNTYHREIESLLLQQTFELEKKHITDELTGLNNSISLQNRLTSGNATLLLINIDNFNLINNSYGYDFGDSLIRQFADFLERIKSQRALLFRLSGDEFVMLFPDMSREFAQKEGERIIKEVENHLFDCNQIDLNITCSIGIASGSKNAILIYAHSALAEAKKLGTGRMKAYEETTDIRHYHQENLQRTREVKSALKEGRIRPYFQPIVDMMSATVVKYECLARIVKGDQVISPAYFIPQAKMIGMLPEITRAMIDKSFAHFARCDHEFTLNITEEDLQEEYLMEFLRSKLAQYAIEPSRVTLEVLENISAEGTGEILEQMKAFKAMGFSIALDDFGSDKSNFHRLLEMDVDYIKIDAMYIRNLDSNPKSEQIVRTIAGFAKNIGAKVVAEYVHNEAVMEKVKALGIDFAQGYYFSEPLAIT